MKFTKDCSQKRETDKLKSALAAADSVLIGAGAGLSAAAGFTYSGERFRKYFGDFNEKYGITDIYSGGFYPFETSEEYWAWWARHIFYNRYVDAPKSVYKKLFELVKDKDYFVLTTNVDHCFQKAGFDKQRLFYTQGDYGLLQCSVPCHKQTYDNEELVRRMVAEQKDMRIPSALIPYCPKCGKPMTVNLRSDDTFVQDSGWDSACARYEKFIAEHKDAKMLLLELGVGMNTPVIIKYPFWRFANRNPKATYACINYGEASCPPQIEKRSVCINADIDAVLNRM
ncbi:MAG: Sir2 silent information regulator family NAD-dependent deacetylase [Bacteroides sp.]|nr:Sir2 silent information regulator family NAD-dependent deacetylase [Prevotella sp.]MCM1408587.1 Sir2 silent information regulator family NAD-dependent deacetylase [Treponema brennaborense]MCM1468925.1 Sir2 silent information regulator family NAD-dependent deacetylase [Bacteroides sp.]